MPGSASGSLPTAGQSVRTAPIAARPCARPAGRSARSRESPPPAGDWIISGLPGDDLADGYSTAWLPGLPVIGVAGYQRTGPVVLFGNEDAHHRVGQRQV